MIEIKYPHYQAGVGEEQKFEENLVPSGVVVDVAAVQAIKICERIPAGHHPSSSSRESYLQITLTGGGTVKVDLNCPDESRHREHARICLHWVKAQIEHVREGT